MFYDLQFAAQPFIIDREVRGQLLRKYSDAVFCEKFCCLFWVLSKIPPERKRRKQVLAEGEFEPRSSSRGNMGAEMATEHQSQIGLRRARPTYPPAQSLDMICPMEGFNFEQGNFLWEQILNRDLAVRYHKAAFLAVSMSLF